MKKFIAFSMCVIMIILLTACGDIVSNSIDAGYLSVAEVNGEAYIKSKFSYVYRLDFDNKTFARASEASVEALDWSNDEFFKHEFFAGEYESTIPEGYDGVISHIDGCKLDDEKSVIYAYGYVYDNVLIGYVQVYKEASGGYGNYAVENISHSVLFEYSSEADEFRILEKIDGVVAVAIHHDTVVYWKNKEYYRYDLAEKAETLLIEDKAYDSGIQQQSWTAVLSNSEYCVIHFKKAKENSDIEYMFIYDFSEDKIYELNCQK